MSGLIDPATTVLTQALSGLTTRQAVISSNLANIDTPNYQAQSVDFETALSQEVEAMYSPQGSALAPASGPSASMAMLTSDPRHFSSIGTDGQGQATTTSTVNETLKNDGNTVDLETEMTALTETQIKYSAVSRLMTNKFGQLSDVLGGK
jgi:flagellar basal-body rod protein FlgB